MNHAPTSVLALDAAEQRFADALDTALAVPYPHVFVRSFEESWILELLLNLGAASGHHVIAWSSARGLYAPDGTSALAELPPSFALLDALGWIGAHEAAAVFVLLDPEPYLGEPAIERFLRELVPILPARRQAVVHLGTRVELPASLVHDATLLDAPLPSRPRLAKVLQEVLPSAAFPLLPRERMVAAALGLTRSEAARAFARVRLAYGRGDHDDDFDWASHVLEEKRRALSANDVVDFVSTAEDLDTVGGLDDLKDWLETRKAAFSQEARLFGLPVPKGLLLVGVQGCGKSLLAKAVAKHWGLPLLRLDLGTIFAGRHAPDAALHRALRIAEALSPCILWTDEIEKGFGPDASGVTQRVLGTVLTWMQEKQSEVFFVATANEVAQLPPELLRKGRFDELFFVDLPDRHARAQIFAIHLRKRQRRPGDFDLAELAKRSERFSGAEIEQVIVAALYEAFADGRELAMSDLLEVIGETVPLYDTREDAIKALREWAANRTRFASKDLRLTDFFSEDDGTVR